MGAAAATDHKVRCMAWVVGMGREQLIPPFPSPVHPHPSALLLFTFPPSSVPPFHSSPNSSSLATFLVGRGKSSLTVPPPPHHPQLPDDRFARSLPPPPTPFPIHSHSPLPFPSRLIHSLNPSSLNQSANLPLPFLPVLCASFSLSRIIKSFIFFYLFARSLVPNMPNFIPIGNKNIQFFHNSERKSPALPKTGLFKIFIWSCASFCDARSCQFLPPPKWGPFASPQPTICRLAWRCNSHSNGPSPPNPIRPVGILS